MSDFNIEFEENDQQITLEFEQAGGGAVKSVNGKTGVVVLTASDVGALPTSTPIPTVDNTLTTAGAAADAKKTGDEIADLKDGLTAVESDVTDLKEDFTAIEGGGNATSDDVGKALLVKTVADGSVSEWEFGDTGATIDIHAEGTALVINTSVVDGNEASY